MHPQLASLARSAGTMTAIACILVLAASPGVASAQDLDGPTSNTVSLFDMGLGRSISFAGGQDSVTVVVPIEPGRTAETLTGTLQLPANLERGFVDAVSDGRILGRVQLPAGVTTLPLSIPLSAATARAGTVTISLDMMATPLDGTCLGFDRQSSIALFDAAVVYSGTPVPPATVADFLPPVLRTLDVFVPADPSVAESSAAVSMAAAVVGFYGAQPVVVTTRSFDAVADIGSAGPYGRAIVLDETAPVGVELLSSTGTSTLRVGGDENAMRNQIELLIGAVADLAVATRVTGSAERGSVQLPPSTTTLGNLGIGPVSTSAAASGVDITLDQTRIGRASDEVRLHLIGSYTPLPNTAGGAVIVRIGDRQLASWPVTADGVIDAWLDVPSARSSTVTVSIDATDSGDRCASTVPTMLTIDGSSEVTSSSESSGIAATFGSLPQAMLPSVDVALGTQDFANTSRAVAIVSGLQRLSAAPLDPRIIEPSAMRAGTRPGILIDADAVPDIAGLPLIATGSTSLNVAGDPTIQVTVDGSIEFASLQTVSESGRVLLVASSNGSPVELDRLLGWLGSEPNRWFALSGDVLFQAAGREPVALTTSSASDSSDSATSGTSTSDRILLWGGILLAVGVIAGAVILVATRRSSRKS